MSRFLLQVSPLGSTFLGGPKLYPNSTAVFFSGLELAKMKKKGSLKVYKEVFDKFVWCNQKRVPCLPKFFFASFFLGGWGCHQSFNGIQYSCKKTAHFNYFFNQRLTLLLTIAMVFMPHLTQFVPQKGNELSEPSIDFQKICLFSGCKHNLFKKIDEMENLQGCTCKHVLKNDQATCKDRSSLVQLAPNWEVFSPLQKIPCSFYVKNLDKGNVCFTWKVDRLW